MHLSRHVNPEDIVQRLQLDNIPAAVGIAAVKEQAETAHLTPYTSPYTSQSGIPKYKIPDDGAPADTVYQMLKDELDLDGQPNLNVASFVSTYMEKNAEQLMADNMAKNLADADEYPALMQIHERCVSILAHLWGVQPNEKAIGSATTGSSEAIHLGGLAMKRRWQEKRRAEGKDDTKPNILMGSNAQVALEKFARYFEVEARILPVSKKSDYRLDPDLVKDNIDENTIGVFVILGSTYTGHYEPVDQIAAILDQYEKETGHDIPIHVDAASGGFVAPFTYAGVGAGHKWDFNIPRVKSINASGHKYGLVYPGVGWIIWRDQSFLPKYLIFELHYLGGTEETYTLNFSRPAAQVAVQYYNLIHLGFNGYRGVMENCLRNARLLSNALEATGWYTCVSDIHRKVPTSEVSEGVVKDSITAPSGEEKSKEGEEEGQEAAPANTKDKVLAVASDVRERFMGTASTATTGARRLASTARTADTSASYVAGLPVVAFRLADTFKKEFPHIKQQTISLLLRARQWIVPNYELPPHEDNTEILRVVIRENMSFGLLEKLITDICQVTQTLAENDEVDLSILQKQKTISVTKEETDESKQKEENDKLIDELGEGEKKAQKGIHKSVC